MVCPRFHVSDESVAAFCRRWKIVEFSLFGSVLREDFGSKSDVDVLVRFSPDASWSLYDYVDMKDELESMFGRPVDFTEADSLENPFRRRRILETRRVVYAV